MQHIVEPSTPATTKASASTSSTATVKYRKVACGRCHHRRCTASRSLWYVLLINLYYFIWVSYFVCVVYLLFLRFRLTMINIEWAIGAVDHCQAHEFHKALMYVYHVSARWVAAVAAGCILKRGVVIFISAHSCCCRYYTYCCCACCTPQNTQRQIYI